jgi:hypothetical protein
MRKYYFAILVVLIFAFFSCSTFPVPESDTDAILIIPIKTTNETTRDFYAKTRIRIKNDRTGESSYFLLTPMKNYLAIKSLDSGSYTIVEKVFVYNKSGKTGSSRSLDINFTLEGRAITILPEIFTFKLARKGPTSSTTYTNFNHVMYEDAERIFNILYSKDEIVHWKFSDRTIRHALYSEFIRK